ncbi:hypothetical protein [Magnetospirillum gryphiswaldense]|uniref:hypothetical protein n=1 Tax=Magnetospirillum gryphiswaldense TaxID=55518 RepID=UPI0018F8652B|nr:hypothetical protein [Magnetospirillum gryphiswaldense]
MAGWAASENTDAASNTLKNFITAPGNPIKASGDHSPNHAYAAWVLRLGRKALQIIAASI